MGVQLGGVSDWLHPIDALRKSASDSARAGGAAAGAASSGAIRAAGDAAGSRIAHGIEVASVIVSAAGVLVMVALLMQGRK